jgi:hypothetical protein
MKATMEKEEGEGADCAVVQWQIKPFYHNITTCEP